jgi:hypothetical protein
MSHIVVNAADLANKTQQKYFPDSNFIYSINSKNKKVHKHFLETKSQDNLFRNKRKSTCMPKRSKH